MPYYILDTTYDNNIFYCFLYFGILNVAVSEISLNDFFFSSRLNFYARNSHTLLARKDGYISKAVSSAYFNLYKTSCLVLHSE